MSNNETSRHDISERSDYMARMTKVKAPVEVRAEVPAKLLTPPRNLGTLVFKKNGGFIFTPPEGSNQPVVAVIPEVAADPFELFMQSFANERDHVVEMSHLMTTTRMRPDTMPSTKSFTSQSIKKPIFSPGL